MTERAKHTIVGYDEAAAQVLCSADEAGAHNWVYYNHIEDCNHCKQSFVVRIMVSVEELL